MSEAIGAYVVNPGPAFGELLRRARVAAGLTQDGLAERAGLSPGAVSALERGVRQTPQDETLRLLLDALHPPAEERLRLAAAAHKRDGRTGPQLRASEDNLAPGADPAPASGTTLVYIAHDLADAAAANRLENELLAYGFVATSTASGVPLANPPGKPELREAVRTAGVVVCIVSPEAGASSSLAHELRVAELYQREVYAFWVAGSTWADCAAEGLAGAQCIDARAGGYQQAVRTLAELLRTRSDRRNSAATTPIRDGHLRSPRNPYKGLRAFSSSDAGDFFGREALVGELVAALAGQDEQAERFLSVVGPSGSGKSSLVLAGLLPRLHAGAIPGSEGWTYLPPVRPGARPLEALSIALAAALPTTPVVAIRADLEASRRGLHLCAARLAPASEQRVVLFVDQLEELFTLTTGETERQRFIDLLVTACTEPHGVLLVVLALRADYYDRPLAYAALGLLLDRHSKAVLPMSAAEWRAAIERPAALPDVQLQFEPDLVGDLLFDVRGEAGALPLLQFTLEQLVEQREGTTLTSAAYQAIGGVRGALARHAESVYASLPSEDHRRLARALFLRLIAPGATAMDATRRRARWVELTLEDPGQTLALGATADTFVAARLLTGSESGGIATIEVGHEALIRVWERLAGWLQAARDDVRIQHAVSSDAAEWERRAREPDNLYRGALLAEAESWAARNLPSAGERAFLAAAAEAEERRLAAEQERQARELALAKRAAAAERSAATRMRVIAATLLVGLLATIVLATVAGQNASSARTERPQAEISARNAVAAGKVALSRQLAAQAVAQLDQRYDRALLLSLEARQEADTVEARSSLLLGVESRPAGLVTFLQGHTQSVDDLALSPDGSILASSSVDGTVRLWNVADRRPIGGPLGGDLSAGGSIAYSPDGTTLAEDRTDGAVRFWDVRRRQFTGVSARSGGGPIRTLAYSPDGKLLACGGSNWTVALLDVKQHRWTSLDMAEYGSVSSVAFSPDGRTLIVAGHRGYVGVVELYDVQSLSLKETIEPDADAVNEVAISPDGGLLAYATSNGTARIWDLTRNRAFGAPIAAQGGAVETVSFSPDGKELAYGGDDGRVRLYDLKQRRPLGDPLAGHTGAVASLRFDRAGMLLFAGTAGGSIAVWQLKAEGTPAPPPIGRAGSVRSIAFSLDGRTLLSGNVDGTLQRWNASDRQPLGPPLAVGGAHVTLSPDGTLLAAGGPGSVADVWKMGASAQYLVSIPAPAFVAAMAFSPDGRMLAIEGGNATIQLWDMHSQEQVGRTLIAPAYSDCIAFSPDGKLLAAADLTGSIWFWDVAHGRFLGELLHTTFWGASQVAFSPDGKVLAYGGSDGVVRLWDMERRRPIGLPLVGHTAAITSIAFSPDSTLIAAGGADDTILLWDVGTGQQLGLSLTGGSGDIASIAFSPNGAELASGAGDGSVRFWQVDLASASKQACLLADRNLTLDEWRQYLDALPYRQVCPGAG